MKDRPHIVVVRTRAATDFVLELESADMSGISPIAAQVTSIIPYVFDTFEGIRGSK